MAQCGNLINIKNDGGNGHAVSITLFFYYAVLLSLYVMVPLHRKDKIGQPGEKTSGRAVTTLYYKCLSRSDT